MAVGNKGIIKYSLGDELVNAPTEWQGIEIEATFDNDSIQANINTDLFTFTLEEAKKIRDYITAGLSGGAGIFEGIPFSLTVDNKSNSYLAFNGFIDLTDGFIDDVESNKVRCKIKKDNGLNSLQTRLSATSFGWLEDQGYITDADYTDIEYIVEKPFNFTEELMSTITLYLMIKELNETIKKTTDLIGEVNAYIATGLTGGLSAGINLLTKTISQTVYSVIMLKGVYELAEAMFNRYLPPKRVSKAMSFRKAIDKMFGYLGYSVETNISDLDTLYYLPSNKNFDEIDNKTGIFKKTKGTLKGIPSTEDFGYRCLDFYELVKKLFNPKIVVTGKVVMIYNEFDDFWIKTSTYKMPSVLTPSFRYNTEELIANRIIYFDTDQKDDWTVKNFTGTNYEVITDAIVVNDKKAKYLSGLDDIAIQLCLSNRKEELLFLEKILLELAQGFDEVVKLFGGTPKYTKRIKSKMGLMKVTSNNWSKPKLVKMRSNRIPVNNRDVCSAKYFYNTYHYGKSFVNLNNYGQKILFDEVRIPFTFEDFMKTINNSYFTDQDGNVGKITSLKWNIAGDYAVVSFWKRQAYTKNLKEITIEA